MKRRVLAASEVLPRVSVDGRRATLTVRVRTPGLRTDGSLAVLLDGKATATRSVGGDAVTVRLGRLAKGSHRVRVRFTGEGAAGSTESLRFRVGR